MIYCPDPIVQAWTQPEPDNVTKLGLAKYDQDLDNNTRPSLDLELDNNTIQSLDLELDNDTRPRLDLELDNNT